MKTITLPATEARNRFFELLEVVAYKGYSIIVEKNKKVFAKIVPESKPEAALYSLDDVIDKTYGMVPEGEWPYESKAVKDKERKLNKGW